MTAALNIGEKVDHTLKMMVYATATGVTAVVALFLFSVGAFVWVARSFGVVEACLALGVTYVALSGIAIGLFVAQRRRRATIQPPAPRPQQPWWHDPIVVTTGIEVARMLGPRKVMSLAAIAAAVLGIVLSALPARKKSSEL